jgi:hypothetical protein
MSTWIGAFDVKQLHICKICIVGKQNKKMFSQEHHKLLGENNYVKIMGIAI